MKKFYKSVEHSDIPSKFSGPTIINAGCQFTGNLDTEADVLVEGEFVGQLRVGGKLIIRPNGIVRSENAECSHTEIYGLFEGSLKVTENLVVYETGCMKGEINVGCCFTILAGGCFDGNCVMHSRESAAFRKQSLAAGQLQGGEKVVAINGKGCDKTDPVKS